MAYFCNGVNLRKRASTDPTHSRFGGSPHGISAHWPPRPVNKGERFSALGKAQSVRQSGGLQVEAVKIGEGSAAGWVSSPALSRILSSPYRETVRVECLEERATI